MSRRVLSDDADVLCSIGAVSCGGSCRYHQWLRRNGHASVPSGSAYSFSECQRLLLIGSSSSGAKSGSSVALQRSGSFLRGGAAQVVVSGDARSAAKQALAGFMRVVAHLDTAPWANEFFVTNDRMIKRLTASHLPLVVGTRAAEEFRDYLVTFIDTRTVLTDARNTIWITNRQQVRCFTVEL